jgi:hypothetical protein
MHRIVKKYAAFLEKSSEKFRQATKKHGVQCRRGCNECCSAGFFDITLLDAIHIRTALKEVPEDIRNRVIAKADEQPDTWRRKRLFPKDLFFKSLPPSTRSPVVRKMLRRPRLESGRRFTTSGRTICRLQANCSRNRAARYVLRGWYFTKDIPKRIFHLLDHYNEEMQKARSKGRAQTHPRGGHDHSRGVDAELEEMAVNGAAEPAPSVYEPAPASTSA